LMQTTIFMLTRLPYPGARADER
jgi:hypothetical protein